MRKSEGLNPTEIDFLRQLSVSELVTLLETFPKETQEQAIALLTAPQLSERERDAIRKKEKRSEASRIVIPPVRNWHRRERSLKDPEKFLLEYFPTKYSIKFGAHHYAMMDTLVDTAKYGTKQATAGPRGCGKSELFKGMLVFLVFACLVRFPLLGGATTKLGRRLYQDFRTKIATNDLLLEDFPEVCYPVRALNGAPQSGPRQHVDGKLTGVVWTANDYIQLADVEGSPYGGVKLSFFGLDSAFRGFNIGGDRPDFVGIDDPETRESAKSYDQGVDREEIIDQDIAGLVSQEENMGIAILTTVQNCYCLSARITDRKIKPDFNGLRFGMIVNWPTNIGMWNDYIAIRHRGQSEGDRFGRDSVQFYLDNREAMDEGVEMLSEHFVKITHEDGTELVHSAIQQAFNKIASTSFESYKKEYQNNPTPDEEDKTLKLTAAMVANRISGYDQNEIPDVDDVKISMGLDMGDYYGHWCKIAWFGNSVGIIIDYGVMEIPTMLPGMDGKAKEIAIERALLAFLPQAMETNAPDWCLIDSGDGDHKDAVYNAVLQTGAPFAASKGWDSGRFRMPKLTEQNKDEIVLFKECYAKYQDEDDIWLYNVNTEWWMHYMQLRFMTETFDKEIFASTGNRVFNDGSLSLYSSDDAKRHTAISHHAVAEKRISRFVEGSGRGKGWVVKWAKLSKNNHWLDAIALAGTAGGCLGVELIKRPELALPPQRNIEATGNRFANPNGRPFVARKS